MKRLSLFLLAALALCFSMSATPLFATTIDFENYGASYNGAVGTPFAIEDATFTGWFLGLDTLPPNYLAVDFGYGPAGMEMANITFSTPVYLTSFDYFTTGVTSQLKYSGTLLDSTNLMSSTGWTVFDGGGALIDEIVFQLPSSPSMAMASINLDNLKYDAVPIPGALCLLASALLGFTGFKKRYGA